jgi:hypothetical protein
MARVDRVIAAAGGDDFTELTAYFGELLKGNYPGAPILFN